MPQRTAVILNDTRGDYHFGCMRVMRTIEENLQTRGVTTLATSLVRNDWERDNTFLDAMNRCDLIVVNGEGTLHHGARYGERLLRVARHPARRGKPVALINALYQDNPAPWCGLLAEFDFLAARDKESQAEMKVASGREVMFCPDLSLGSGLIAGCRDERRQEITFGDSVLKDVSRQLMTLANVSGAPFVLIQNRLKLPKPNQPAPLRLLRSGYAVIYEKLARVRNSNLVVPATESEFIDWLFKSRLHVTGRFHAVCLCLATLTPFIAIKSNSRKIESLLEFFQLGSERIVAPEKLSDALENERFAQFSEAEHSRILAALTRSRALANNLFDTLAARQC